MDVAFLKVNHVILCVFFLILLSFTFAAQFGVYDISGLLHFLLLFLLVLHHFHNNNNNNNHNNRLIPLGDVMYMDYMSLDLVKNQILDIIHHPCNNVTRKTNPTFTTRNIMKCMGRKLPQINKYWE